MEPIKQLMIESVNRTIDEMQCLGADNIVDGLLPIVIKACGQSFDNGIVYACASIINLHDQPVIAKDVLLGSGADIKYAAKEDIKTLLKADVIGETDD